MKFVLAFYSDFDGDKTEPVEHNGVKMDVRVGVDYDKVSEYAKLNRPSGDTSLFLRSAEAFNGTIETHGDQLPVAVILLGDGEAMDRVREAYEAVDVEVQTGSLDDEDANSNLAPSGEGDPFGGDIVKLKERATDIGITFSPTIGYKNLLARVQAKEKEKEESSQTGGE